MPAPVSQRRRRSVLFMPASNTRALEKARSLTADVVVFDLEDAVAPEAKDAARLSAVEAVRSGAYGDAEVAVRVNAPDSEVGLADLDAVAAAAPDALVLPKVEDAETLDRLCAALDEGGAPRGMAVWAMIETPRGAARLGEIAALGARRRLGALVAGVNDFALAMGCAPGADRANLTPYLMGLVTVARAYGLAAIDGVYNAHADLEGFAREAAQTRAMGFDGKSLIHPNQIEPVHAAFRPSEEEIAWARKVVAAFADPAVAAAGAISLDGAMVERLHLEAAQRALRAVDDADA